MGVVYLWLLVFLNPEDALPGTEPIAVMAVVLALAVACAWVFPRVGGILTVLSGLGLWAAVSVFGGDITNSAVIDGALSFVLFGLPPVIAGGMFLVAERMQRETADRAEGAP